jgi:uncharacterized protein
MKIGITGATGFLGSALGALAAGGGHEVVAFSRSGKVERPWVTESRRMADEPDLSGCDAVVHLAGESLMGYWTRAKRDRIWQSRVDGTRHLVAAMERASPRPRILLCASGAGYYGSRGDEVLEESSPKGEGFLSDLCREWEAAAKSAERLNARVVMLRTGMVLGQEGGAFPLLKKVFGLGLGGRLGSGRQWTSWIHVEDHARLMLWALENSAVSGPVNFVAPNPVTNAEFTRVLAQSLKRPAFFHAPAFALRLLLRDMADEMLLTSQRTMPRAALDLGFEFRKGDFPKAVASLV